MDIVQKLTATMVLLIALHAYKLVHVQDALKDSYLIMPQEHLLVLLLQVPVPVLLIIVWNVFLIIQDNAVNVLNLTMSVTEFVYVGSKIVYHVNKLHYRAITVQVHYFQLYKQTDVYLVHL